MGIAVLLNYTYTVKWVHLPKYQYQFHIYSAISISHKVVHMNFAHIDNWINLPIMFFYPEIYHFSGLPEPEVDWSDRMCQAGGEMLILNG